MKRFFYLPAFVGLLPLLLFASDGIAQDASRVLSPPQVDGAQQFSEAEKKLFATIKKMNEELAGVSEFQLVLSNEISIKSSKGKIPAPRKIELKLHSKRSEANAHIQLQWLQAGKSRPAFVVDWEKSESTGTLTRAFLPEKLVSKTESADLRNDLRQCQFTADNLNAAHADFLLQPDLLQHVQSQVVHVVDMSKPEQPPHFQLEFSDGRAVEIWFQESDGKTLPQKLESHQVTFLGKDQKVDTVTTGSFDWKFGDDAEEWFKLSAAKDLRAVNDLRNAMLGRDTSDVAGNNIPNIMLKSLDGADVSMVKEFGTSEKPVLLYFWATWAAPSVRELAGVQEFAKELSEAGVLIHPVNVGEPAEQIKKFLESRNVPFQVWRDADGQLIEKLGIGKLPSVVILHKGKIVLVREGVGPDNREQVRKELMGLTTKE